MFTSKNHEILLGKPQNFFFSGKATKRGRGRGVKAVPLKKTFSRLPLLKYNFSQNSYIERIDSRMIFSTQVDPTFFKMRSGFDFFQIRIPSKHRILSTKNIVQGIYYNFIHK